MTPTPSQGAGVFTSGPCEIPLNPQAGTQMPVPVTGDGRLRVSRAFHDDSGTEGP